MYYLCTFIEPFTLASWATYLHSTRYSESNYAVETFLLRVSINLKIRSVSFPSDLMIPSKVILIRVYREHVLHKFAN